MAIETFSHKFNIHNPHQLDAYLLHLAEINIHCGVVAAENIYNSLGVLIVNSGVRITPLLANTILHCTLVKPLETIVRLERELDAAQLAADLVEIIEQDNILSALNEYQNLTPALKIFCQNSMQYAVLRQKLTVMSHVLPELYQRSLYCALLSFLIAKEMRLSESDQELVFLAGLSHDIGLLHVDPNVLNHKDTLTADEWLHIQRHVVISSQLLQSMPDMPIAVAQAVYDHHERCDGTGYPYGKVESELTFPGLIVGLADSVVAIYYHRFKTQGGTWLDAIPIIQMNTQAYFYRNYEILVAVLRRSELPKKNVIEGDATPQFIADLAQKNNQLKKWFDTLNDALVSIGFRHGDRRLYSLQNVMLHVSTSVEGSGIFKGQELLANANNLCKEVDREIENTHLMQQEIIFHLQRLSRMTQLYIDSGDCKKNEIKSVLVEGLAKAQQFAI
ncbi:MAG: HD domain-containing phosphohydrolase [Pseudomonadota bacterium]